MFSWPAQIWFPFSDTCCPQSDKGLIPRLAPLLLCLLTRYPAENSANQHADLQFPIHTYLFGSFLRSCCFLLPMMSPAGLSLVR